MSTTTVSGAPGDVLRVTHADGGMTIVAFGADADIVIMLDANTVRRCSDRRAYPHLSWGAKATQA